MAIATEQLLKDHKMARKILEGFSIDHPRFPDILKTLQRVVLGHAWFEDEFLLPVLKVQPLIFRPFFNEIGQEHEDIAALLAHLRATPHEKTEDIRAGVLTLRSLLETHFSKEEDALFPLAERVISEEGLTRMAAEMESRKADVRAVLPD